MQTEIARTAWSSSTFVSKRHISTGDGICIQRGGGTDHTDAKSTGTTLKRCSVVPATEAHVPTPKTCTPRAPSSKVFKLRSPSAQISGTAVCVLVINEFTEDGSFFDTRLTRKCYQGILHSLPDRHTIDFQWSIKWQEFLTASCVL